MLEFEWDEQKNAENFAKHGLSFVEATSAFADPNWVLQEDEKHSFGEQRFFCIGIVNGEPLTVRFTFRGDVIRIFGAGYWRKGKREYEKRNKMG